MVTPSGILAGRDSRKAVVVMVNGFDRMLFGVAVARTI